LNDVALPKRRELTKRTKTSTSTEELFSTSENIIAERKATLKLNTLTCPSFSFHFIVVATFHKSFQSSFNLCVSNQGTQQSIEN
jgi:hypothetical protein